MTNASRAGPAGQCQADLGEHAAEPRRQPGMRNGQPVDLLREGPRRATVVVTAKPSDLHLNQQRHAGYRNVAQSALITPMDSARPLLALAAASGRCPDPARQHHHAVTLLNSLDRQTRQMRQ
jgi:hypothetical protein